jgi:hypothetical protein
MPNIQTVLLSAAVGAAVAVLLEFFRTRMGGSYWLAQERWKLKRDTYTKLLEGLTAYRRVADRQVSMAMRADRFTEEDLERDRKNLEEMTALSHSLDQARAVAQMWLGTEAKATLVGLWNAMHGNQVRMLTADDQPETWRRLSQETSDIITAAEALLLFCANEDLRLQPSFFRRTWRRLRWRRALAASSPHAVSARRSA